MNGPVFFLFNIRTVQVVGRVMLYVMLYGYL